MKFKKLKYNIISGLLLVVFALMVGFTTVYSMNSGESSSGEQDEPKPEEPSILPDVSETLKSFKSWYQMYEFSKDIQDSFPSLVSKSTHKVTTTIPVIGEGVQNLKVRRYRNSNERFESTFTQCDASIGSNMYRNAYMYDGKVYTREITNRNNFSFNDETFTFTDEETIVQTVEERLANNQVLPCEEGVMPSRKNCTGTIDKYSNANYYILKLDYILSQLPVSYTQNMLSTGQLKAVNMNSIKVNVYISKKTGTLYKKEVIENYTIVPTMLSVNLACKAEASYIYTSYDEEIKIDKGY